MESKDLIYDWNTRDAAFDYARAPVVLNDETLRVIEEELDEREMISSADPLRG